MAGEEEYYNYIRPRVRSYWECEMHDEACMYAAKNQARRDEKTAYQKSEILKKRFWACRMIHKNNTKIYCREEEMRLMDAVRRYYQMNNNSTFYNALHPGEMLDGKPYEPIRPDDYQLLRDNDPSGFSRLPYPNTHREPIEVVQMDAAKRKPHVDPDRPSVSVRLFDYTHREVVVDLPPKKPELPKVITSYDPEKFKKQ